MKIVYATDINASNIHSWSGLGWYYRSMLEQVYGDVTTIDKAQMPHPFFDKVKQRLFKTVRYKLYSPRFSIDVSKYYAKQIHALVPSGSVVLSPNTVILAYLKKDLKKVLFADATFDSLFHLYPKYSEYTKQCLKEGEAIDRQAVANADVLIYTSQWAANSAINHYGADPSKIAIVPFGANLDHLPSAEDVSQSIQKRMHDKHTNLLFLGIDWIRKGGDYALQVTQKLNAAGFPATLHIVGATNVPENLDKTFVVNHGFISKATPEGQQQLGILLAMSHFLLLPTLADCTPVACSEAAAFGVPCLTSDVGGLKSIITADVNGRTFSHTHFVEDVVGYMISLLQSKAAYSELCFSSFHQYETTLNWKSVGERIVQLIQKVRV
ncbi:MAG TPA: glycosyltransferase family 4 protein [Chitinophagaceae bacterium]|nr:glycosyltransferase family 4 protein [Chitinophagaceae bacterium]